ncbi:uncharacterized protein LODBEIA_P27840 [Lodderomyces beijingensis]|uniref:Mitochondrial import inner membrane translocase subunit Tim21 n=1 Tax=Lodderomyces beijingensis TaxID=1775926 RepID=A0ABP0ZK92_9ASCO
MNCLRLHNPNLRAFALKRVQSTHWAAPASLLTRTYLTKPCSQPLPINPLLLTSRLTKFNYSTRTAPPPPPPPPPSGGRNAKGEKILNRISRAFTFSLSTVIVIAASGVAMLVLYLIISELFFPSGDTTTFNKAVSLIQDNAEAQKVLGFPAGERLKAYGIVAADRWVRNRPVQSAKRKGQDGKDHLFMKFQVETSKGNYGVVTLEQVDYSWWSTKFEYISLDVPGHRTVYIVAPPRPHIAPAVGKGTGFLGLNWGPKKD